MMVGILHYCYIMDSSCTTPRVRTTNGAHDSHDQRCVVPATPLHVHYAACVSATPRPSYRSVCSTTRRSQCDHELAQQVCDLTRACESTVWHFIPSWSLQVNLHPNSPC